MSVFANARRSLLRFGGVTAPLGVGLLLAITLCACPAFAVEAKEHSELAEFFGVLRQRGYGDFVVEYLEARKDDPTLPEDVRSVWELEMANSLWAAATFAHGETQIQTLRDKAQKHLESFLKAHPNDPAVADAMATWGGASLDRAVILLKAAKLAEKDAERRPMITQAKELLNDAQTRLEKAQQAFQQQIAAAKGKGAMSGGQPAGGEQPPAEAKPEEQAKPADGEAAAKEKEKDEGGGEGKPAAPANRGMELEDRLAGVRFKAALADYWTAQTYDESAPERSASLKKAADVLKELYRKYRGELGGLNAHYWHARILSENGKSEDVQDAQEMCDEILTIAPDKIPKDINPQMLNLIADTYILDWQLRTKSEPPEHVIAEASNWVKGNQKDIGDTPGYQGMALELIKMRMKLINRVPVSQQPAIKKEVTELLARIVKVPSPYQREAQAYQRKLSQQLPKPRGGESHEEARALGETAFAGKQWKTAADYFVKALELLEKSRLKPEERKKQTDDIRERLAFVRYQMAAALAQKQKYLEASEACEKIARDLPETEFASTAAVLAMRIEQYQGYDSKVAEPIRKPHLDRMVQLASMIVKLWPSRPEANDARLAIAKVHLQRNEAKEAITILREVPPTSPRYASAMLEAGRYAWRRYLEEREKPEKERKAVVMEKSLQSAVDWLTKAVAGFNKSVTDKKDPDQERQRAIAARLLADALSASGRAKDAAASYQPLVDEALKSEKLDNSEVRILASAIKVNIDIKDMAKASQIGVELARRSADDPGLNKLLVRTAQHLAQDVKLADAENIKAKHGKDNKQAVKARKRFEEAQANAAKLLTELAKRKNLALGEMIIVADSSVRVGLKKEGAQLFQQILIKAAEKTQDQTMTAAIVHCRAELVGLLREEGKFAEADTQITSLLNDYPKSLDLMMQHGRILQAWAEKDKDPKRFALAREQWTQLQGMLGAVKEPQKEYYEVVYYSAECLIAESELTQKPESANTAEQLLKTTLVLKPNLSGPDMVARYKVLIEKAATLQGRDTAAASE